MVTGGGVRWRGESVAAVVLAGGRSSRFGRDKALASVGGVPLLRRALSATAALSPTWVVAGSAERAKALAAGLAPSVRVVPDDRPGAGPIGGIATALRLAGTGWVAVLAVDLPLIGAGWWPALMGAADRAEGPTDAALAAAARPAGGDGGLATGPADAATGGPGGDARTLRHRAIAVRHPDGRWEPLAALYHTDLADEARARAAPGGDPALQRFLNAANARAIDPASLPVDAVEALHNVNAPADAATAEQRWARRP